MPQITGGTLIAPFTGLPLTGAIAISSDRSDNCGKSCNCLVVTFKNGVQQKAINYNAYGSSTVDLPVSVPADVYYGVVSGDPAIVACDPSRLCSSLPFYRSGLSSVLTWADLATYQSATPLPVQSTAVTQAKIKELESELVILKARNAALMKRSETLAVESGVEQLIRSLDLLTCPPEQPIEQPSKNPCCNPAEKEETNTVSSLMQSIGYHGEDKIEESTNADRNQCNPVKVC
jgi:hypothetical protein